MRRPHSLVGLPLLAALLLAIPLAAPARQAGEPVRLAFQFTRGAVTRYRLTANEALAFRVREAPPGFPGLPPIAADATMDFTQRVLKVATDGTASLKVNFGDLRVSVNQQNQQIVIRSQKGKMTATIDGKTVTLEEAVASDLLDDFRQGITFKASPLGEIDNVDSPLGSMVGALPGADLARAFGGFGFSGLTLAPFPPEPKQPGETWEKEVRVPGPVGEVVIQFESTLKSVGTVQGRKIATILTTGSATLNPASPAPLLIGQIPGADMKIAKMQEFFDGSARFDIARGQMVSGKTNVDIRLLLAIGGSATAGRQIQANVDGQITLNVTPVPVPKKKPAR